MVQFPTCSLHISQDRFSVVGAEYGEGQIEILIEEYHGRLSVSCEEELQLKVIEDPFLADPKYAPQHVVQLEVIGLLNKRKQMESSLQDFHKCLNKKCKYLLILAKQMFSLFGEN